MPGSRRTSLYWALCLASLCTGCGDSGGSGGILSVGTGQDGQASEGDPSPPDLPVPSCDPRREDDCELGFKCSYVVDPDFGATNRCVPLLGDGEAGDPCERFEDSDSDSCASHHLCWGMEPDGSAGLCVEFCDPMLTCSGAEMVCSVSTNELLPLCLRACDPLLQDCLPSWGCYPDTAKRWSCDRDRSGVGGAHGQPCDCLNCCDPGLTCRAAGLVESEGCSEEEVVGCCAELCMVEEEPPPPEEEWVCPGEFERCRSFYLVGSVLDGYEHVGVCGL